MINIKINPQKLKYLKETAQDEIDRILNSPQRYGHDEMVLQAFQKQIKIESFTDVFWEYKDVVTEIINENMTFVSDTEVIDPDKFIVTSEPNAFYYVKMLSDHELIELDNIDCPIPYGVCDNASQILNHYQPKQDEVVLMFPVIRKDEPKKIGWRWHKWGDYIGEHNIQYEYIYDEEGIDVVFCFSIYKIVPIN